MMNRIFYIGLILLIGVTSNAQNFTDVSFDAGIDFLVDHQSYFGGGAAFFDYDNDGNQDLYLTGGEDRDRLFHNNGDGTFTNVTTQAGFDSTKNVMSGGVATGDIDNDGFREVFITTWDRNNENELASNILYKNNGDGTFTDISEMAGIQDSVFSAAASFGDFNLDGFIDIFVTNYVESTGFIKDSASNVIIGFDHNCFSDLLYMNNGDGTFTDRSLEFNINEKGCGLATAATDYDNDGNIDLMVANDFGEWTVPNRLYKNPGFDNVSVASGADIALYGMGIAIGDYDEDNDLDYYISNLGRNALLQNQGNGTFTDMATEADVENTAVDSLLVTSWGSAFFDYDNDTYLDLYVCNGYMPAAAFIETTYEDPNKLYRNNQDGTFTEVAATEGVADQHVGRGMAIADYDNDGDMDMVIANINNFITPEAKVILYRNEHNATTSNWAKVSLEGVVSNRDAFGAHARLHAGGRIFLREVDGGSSHASQHSSILHFGLGQMTEIDSMVITWPGGRIQKVCDLPINTESYILEDTSATAGTMACYTPPPSSLSNLSPEEIGLKNIPNPFHQGTIIQYHLPQNAEVELAVYDVLGQVKQLLVNEFQTKGPQSIDFSPRDSGLAAGVYFYSLKIEGQVFTKRMVQVK